MEPRHRRETPLLRHPDFSVSHARIWRQSRLLGGGPAEQALKVIPTEEPLLVVATAEGRQILYEIADPSLTHAIRDLLDVVLAVECEDCDG